MAITKQMARHAPAAIKMRSKKSSDASEIAMLLTKLSYARQAPIDPNSLDYFSAELARFHIDDVTAAIDKLCRTRRREGETAFPDLPTLLDGIREARISRLTLEGDWPPGERQFREYLDDIKAHPDHYVSIADIVADLAKRKTMK